MIITLLLKRPILDISQDFQLIVQFIFTENWQPCHNYQKTTRCTVAAWAKEDQPFFTNEVNAGFFDDYTIKDMDLVNLENQVDSMNAEETKALDEIVKAASELLTEDPLHSD